LSTGTCGKCGSRFAFFVSPEVSQEASSSGDESHDSEHSAQGSEQSLHRHEISSRFFFHGTGGPLFGIYVVNIFLTLLSLGLYYFWAKVRVRRYLLSHIEFREDRFAYLGTGKEMLKGFLKAVLVFGIPYAVLVFVPGWVGASGVVQAGAFFLAQGLILVFIPSTMVSARRYRLSRLSWRGIRFSFRARRGEFVRLYLKGWLLTLLTLGAYYPFFDVKRQAFLVSHSFVGNQPFRFDGHGWDLSPSLFTTCLLTPFTLGLCWLWYMAKRQRYFWDHTACAAAHFRSTVTGRLLLNLKAENLLLLVLTLGLAGPWVAVRNLRFILTHLSLEGLQDLDRLLQEAHDATPTGDVLADFLDTGVDLG